MFTTETRSVSYGGPLIDFSDAFLTAFLVFTLFVLLVCVVPFWNIFRKAGFPGALALLMPVPGVNLVLLYILAFGEWPSLRKRKEDVL